MSASAFATVGQVESLNKARTYGASSKPTTGEVAQYLIETAGEINGVLRARGYSIPVATGTADSLAHLSYVNSLGGAMLAETAAQVSESRNEYINLYRHALAMLGDGKIELDIASDAEQVEPRWPAAPTPFFTRDMQF